MDEDGKLIDKIMLYKNVKAKTYKLTDNKNNLLEIFYFKNRPKIKNFKLNHTLLGSHISQLL